MSTELTVQPARSSPSQNRAAILSFLWPGLGQWYMGRPRSAVLFALPVLGVVLLVIVQALTSVGELAALLLTPTSALTVLILITLMGVWRVLAIADAMTPSRVHAAVRRRPGASTFAVLALVVLVSHAAVGYVVWAFYDASSQIFVGEHTPDASPSPSILPGATRAPDEEYVVDPIATPATAEHRINVLLTGIDSAETRSTALTDTLLVASVDPTTGHVALISFPRDIASFPLWDGRTYEGKINGLMTWARNHPEEFPDGPLETVMLEIGFLLGSPIHYYAAVDLAGFREMIDLAGGVTIDNPRAIDDPRYDWLDGRRGFALAAGVHHLDGVTALAYVRSRQGAGDTDFSRARRQQQVLLALQAQLTRPEALGDLPALLETAGKTVRTNFPSDRLGEMIDLARGMDSESVTQVVLGPRKYASVPPASETGGIYELRLDMGALAALSMELFGSDSRYATAD